ncbi:MAG: hypothetical protein N4A47_07185 [Clostridia bacterium]|jgi:hypothetical protein|nr:hypothetical protein [Clostridia bacterium]
MKRLIKVGLDILLFSIVPVITWFVLGIIIGGNIISIFIVSYPIQFIVEMLKSIFATGANISQSKDGLKGSVMSGAVIGIVVGTIMWALMLMNVDNYMHFMNVSGATYKLFLTYAIAQMFLQYVLRIVLMKLYYEGDNIRANNYTVKFNALNFFILISSILLTNNYITAVIITLVAMSIYTLFVCVKVFEKFKFNFNLTNALKYDSLDLFSNFSMFVIYMVGVNNIMQYGKEYVVAITFVTLITDTQWDISDAVTVVAKIDISQNKFILKKHIKNAYKLLSILLMSTIIMLLVLFRYYDLNLTIVLISLSVDVLGFVLYPIYIVKTCYLQIEYSPMKTTSNKVISNALRTGASFLRTPYCTGIGQLISCIYQTITINAIFKKNYEIDKETGIIIKKRKIIGEEIG